MMIKQRFVSLGLISTILITPVTSTHADVMMLLQAAAQIGQLAYGANQVRVDSNTRINLKKSLLGSKAECLNPVGSIMIHENETDDFQFYGLSSPTRVLQAIIDESNCFTVVNRGAGFDALQKERALGNSALANAKVRSADYILVPEIITQNAHAGGNQLGAEANHNDGILNLAGAVNLKSKKKTAEVVLSLVDVRTSEQIISITNEAVINDKDWGMMVNASNAVTTEGRARMSGWNNTEIGKVIKTAYENTYKDMILAVGKKNLLAKYGNNATYTVLSNTTAGSPSSPQVVTITQAESRLVNHETMNADLSLQTLTSAKTLVLKRDSRIFKEPNTASNVVIIAKEGVLVYPTGEVEQKMLKVEDEQGHIGWISSASVNPYLAP